jgi:hypothetical protein
MGAPVSDSATAGSALAGAAGAAAGSVGAGLGTAAGLSEPTAPVGSDVAVVGARDVGALASTLDGGAAAVGEETEDSGSATAPDTGVDDGATPADGPADGAAVTGTAVVAVGCAAGGRLPPAEVALPLAEAVAKPEGADPLLLAAVLRRPPARDACVAAVAARWRR